MYHVRAARALDNYPLVVYNCIEPTVADPITSRRPSDLEKYLSAPTGSPCGQTSASHKVKFAKPASAAGSRSFFDVTFTDGEAMTVPPEDFIRISKVYLITEGECTSRIVGKAIKAIENDRSATTNAKDQAPVASANGQAAAASANGQDAVDNAKPGEQTATLLKIMAEGMVQIDADIKDKIDVWLLGLLPKIFNFKDSNGVPKMDMVLIMHRNTGITIGPRAYIDDAIVNANRGSIAKGTYPENDTDDTTCSQLKTIIEDANWEDGSKATAVLCGNADGTVPAIPSIHEWFKQLNISELKSSDPVQDRIRTFATKNEIRSRDVEARFMQLAFKKRYIRLVVGFRSGALDMFTFLGIPTVSLQLCGLVGEERMNQLSPDPSAHGNEASKLFDSHNFNVFKRLNINYVTPRHDATKLCKSTRTNKPEKYNYNSPFWAGDFQFSGPLPEPAERRTLHTAPTKQFSGPDYHLVKEGIKTFMKALPPPPPKLAPST
ncbi:unnamed protein product [Tilletia laevis]|uniref:Uncharacterized protein n=2 Tax=Tilletia TaxID=13289 RepID=A0A177VCQ8_9BASI|nr:hypothetical protein CF336_g2529 [Tilletia laevis]KAE8263317.1 hypothetical protein A4X03_0g1772 [Tilletia caries]KAE8206880.1 hypothetical protein CF335_g1548 [Tilletia laevis]CAD6891725.1 unnamed protein product [Tilletia caries]CAD6898447.1 unnamed protein product [Tilletia laevis]